MFDITWCPDHFLKHNLAHGFIDMFASISRVQSLYIPFGLAQNNSVFVWKTSNFSCGRPNVKNDRNQRTNLKSLGFTWKRIANLLGFFPEVVFCNIDFRGFFDVAFDPHISSIIRFVVERVAKLVSFVSVAEVDDSPEQSS